MFGGKCCDVDLRCTFWWSRRKARQGSGQARRLNASRMSTTYTVYARLVCALDVSYFSVLFARWCWRMQAASRATFESFLCTHNAGPDRMVPPTALLEIARGEWGKAKPLKAEM